MSRFSVITLLAILFPVLAFSQWTNRYPKVEGFGHHVYLEGFELPILNSGPMDPAPSPLGDKLAFTAKGWLWLMNLDTGTSSRITHSGGVDSRPEWSLDGRDLVFIRDSGSTLSIVTVDVASGVERTLVATNAINLDPVFSADGNFVYYSSSESGQLELWRVALDSLDREQVTTSAQLLGRPLKRRPLSLADDNMILFLNKYDGRDFIALYNTVTQSTTPLVQDRLTAQADMTLSPDRKYLAYTWPYDGGHELRLMAISAPDTSILLTQSLGMPLAPAFSADGNWIYFAEAGESERTELKRISVSGGAVEKVSVGEMDWGTETGTLQVRTRINGRTAPARLNVLDQSGHPVVPEHGAIRFDGQNGRVFYYSDGTIEVTAPAGSVAVSAVQGFETPEAVSKIAVRANATTRITLDLEPVWDASANGWHSADTHFHLNYGGPYRLAPEDMLGDMHGEGLDMAFPLLANLHNRFLQEELWGWTNENGPRVYFGQEIRSHFLGHIQQLGSDELFWPWIWGPGYQVYGDDDRSNVTALRHSRDHGGLGGYVHPVSVSDPLTPESAASVPVGLVADAVLGEVDFIELACLWTDEIGTSAVWHKLLNVGIPVAASAGSDVMMDYYRTMAVGSTRLYVETRGRLNEQSYLEGLKAGRSFVSNGPMLEFEIDGQGPGDVVELDNDTLHWTASVHSALPVDRLEIIVNGKVVETFDGLPEPGSREFEGTLQAPQGGWATARVLGENAGWPAMDSYLFAETSPVWFGDIGSTDADVARESASSLLMILDNARSRLQAGYRNVQIPKLLAQFEAARSKLETLAEE